MKTEFDVADKGVTAHSCMLLLALSRGVHSHDADLLVHLFIKTHSDDFLREFIHGIMKSTFEHAKQVLQGGDNMT